MLKTLPKYIIREHVGPFFFALAVINSIFILNLVFKQLEKFLSKDIPFSIIIEFLFLNLAWMVALSVPMAVLPATIMAFGRLSAEHEITAMRASGISLSRILLLVLSVALGLCLGLIWFNNNVLPDFNHQARLLAVDIARKKPMINLASGVLYTDIPNYSILVQQVQETNGVSNVDTVMISDHSERDIITTITADHGELQMNEKTGVLDITLYDGEMQKVDINKPESLSKLAFSKQILKIPMQASLLRRTDSGYRGDREKSAADLMMGVRENQKRIAERHEKLSELIDRNIEKYARPSGEKQTVGELIQDQQQFRRQVQTEVNLIKNYQRQCDIYLVEYYKKYSIPAACLVYILIGAPLGILTRQRGWALAAVTSIGFFLLYWAFLIGGEILADRQIISPFIAMWSPNILVGGLGIYLVLRIIQERSLIRLPWS